MYKIRLGFPEKIEIAPGEYVYPGWFWGERKGWKAEWNDDWYREYKSTGKLGTAAQQEGRTHDNLRYFHQNSWFICDNYESFLQRGENFIISIDIQMSYSPEEDLQWLKTVRFSENVLEIIRRGQAKVLFTSHQEGYITGGHFDCIEQFCKNNRLQVGEVYVSSANLDESKLPPISKRTFRYRAVNYFGEASWWLGKSKTGDEQQTLQAYIKDNRENPKKFTFTLLNRRPDWQRTYLVGYFRSSEELSKKSIVSFGLGPEKVWTFPYRDWILKSLSYVPDDQIGRSRVIKYFQDTEEEAFFSSPDVDKEVRTNPVIFNPRIYRNSFMTLVTETFYDQNFKNPRMFFSEKTFKVIYGLQPFVLVSVPGSLQALRELGFKTFSRWWDESYDLEQNPHRRLAKICKLVDLISSKTSEELYEITQDMEDTLEHNWKTLMSCQDLHNTFQWFTKLC